MQDGRLLSSLLTFGHFLKHNMAVNTCGPPGVESGLPHPHRASGAMGDPGKGGRPCQDANDAQCRLGEASVRVVTNAEEVRE